MRGGKEDSMDQQAEQEACNPGELEGGARQDGKEGEALKGTEAQPAPAAAPAAEAAIRAPSVPPPAPPQPEALLSSGEYECRICYNFFDLERHAPKLLECLHTFCQDCLAQLHLRGGEHSPRGRGAPPDSHLTCPVCRHRTALPDGRVHSLPVNTKLVEGILQQLRGWAPLLRDLRAQRLLLLQVPRPPARQPSPTSDRSSGAATITVGSPDASCSEDPGDGHCCASCRRKAGCVCLVFTFLAMVLLGFAWMEWLTGSIFLGVALVLLFASTVPFMYSYKSRSEPRTIFFARATAGGSREVASGRSTPGGRGAAESRSRC
ncbi:RING finger protein 228 [Podarcis muralis]